MNRKVFIGILLAVAAVLLLILFIAMTGAIFGWWGPKEYKLTGNNVQDLKWYYIPEDMPDRPN